MARQCLRLDLLNALLCILSYIFLMLESMIETDYSLPTQLTNLSKTNYLQ